MTLRYWAVHFPQALSKSLTHKIVKTDLGIVARNMFFVICLLLIINDCNASG